MENENIKMQKDEKHKDKKKKRREPWICLRIRHINQGNVEIRYFYFRFFFISFKRIHRIYWRINGKIE